MTISFSGKNWDTKKTYYMAGREVQGVWKPYEDVEDLAEGGTGSAKPCRIVRVFIGDDGEAESLLMKRSDTKEYCVLRLGWAPTEFVDTTEKKVLANIRKLAPKKGRGEK